MSSCITQPFSYCSPVLLELSSICRFSAGRCLSHLSISRGLLQLIPGTLVLKSPARAYSRCNCDRCRGHPFTSGAAEKQINKHLLNAFCVPGLFWAALLRLAHFILTTAQEVVLLFIYNWSSERLRKGQGHRAVKGEAGIKPRLTSSYLASALQPSWRKRATLCFLRHLGKGLWQGTHWHLAWEQGHP